MAYLKAEELVSGQEGRAYAQIDGRNEEMLYLKDIEATIKKTKSDVKVLGKRGVQKKTTGWTGTGSMTVYYVTSVFRKMMTDYIRTGIDTHFDIVVVNDDPLSGFGTQTVVLKNCNLDSVILAKIDTGSDELDEKMDFTFEDVEILDEFTV